MAVTTPPRTTEAEHDRDLAQRVADLEALIEEARRRARRRWIRNGSALVVAAAAVVAGLIGFGGHGGNTTGTTALAATRNGPGSNTNGRSLGALPLSLGFVESFAFDPRNPRIVYVLGQGLVKSTDAGARWKVMPTGQWAGGADALAADPRRPGTLYVGTARGAFKTVDGGQTWRRSARGLLVPHVRDRRGWVSALAVDPENSRILYAGTNRISKSIDGGRSWKPVFAPEPTAANRNAVSVTALAIAPTDPETIYAIHANSRTGHTSIYTSTDAGATWKTSISLPGFVHGFVTDLAVDPRHPTTVYAAVAANVLKTTDAGRTWQRIGYGLPVHADVRQQGCRCRDGVTTLAVDTHRPGVVYAGVNEGGIYQTTNGGRSWEEVAARSLYYRTIVGVDPRQPATVYGFGELEYDNSPHLFRTTNAGRTWAAAP